MPDKAESALKLGRLGRTIGLDGGLLFHAAGSAEAALLEPGVTVLVENAGELTVSATRRHNRGTVLHFEGIRRPERARELTNADVSIPAGNLPDQFRATDLESGLMGLPVLLNGTVLGHVADVQGVAGHEYLVLEPSGGLIPLGAPYVVVDDSGVTLVDPPAGLL